MKIISLMAGLALGCAGILLSLFAPSAAFAQDAAPAAASAIDPSSSLYVLWTVVQPIVTLLVTVFGPVVIGLICTKIYQVLKITDANQQAALQAQLSTAIHQSAANALQYSLSALKLPASAALSNEVISLATSYVKDKNPEGLAKLGVTPQQLTDILTAKAQVVASPPVNPTPQVDMTVNAVVAK